jgi:capsular exopolysaccharide synthesis family protein
VSNQVDAIATAILQPVRAKRVGQTALFDIEYTDRDPLKAAEIANGFADGYLKESAFQKVAQSQDDSAQLNQKLEFYRKQAEQADAAVAQYRRENGILSAPDSPALDQEISLINQQLSEARAQQAESSAKYAASQRQVNGGDFGDALASQTISNLRSQKAEVARKVAELSSRYGPRHPQLMDAQKELSEIDAQIQQEVGRQQSNVRSQTNVSSQRVASLEASLGAARARAANGVSSSVRLQDLEREATTAQQVYTSLLASSVQASASQSLAQADAQLTSPASPPLKPSSPNLAINLFLGLILGLGIGIGIAYLRERWAVGLNTIDDIERYLDQQFLNSIPTLDTSIDKPKTKDPIEAVMVHRLSLYAEAFRNLATTLLYTGKAGATKVIGITSALPKEGKTTTSAALARVMAMSGSKVLLMDCDLRRRSVTLALSPDAKQGLIQVLNGECTLDQAIVEDASGAGILPLAPDSHLGRQPFDSPEFEKMMAQLRQVFDVIIVDTAPVLAVADTRLMIRHLDSLALLARWRVTPLKAIRAAIHQIEGVGGEIRGVAMTLVNLKTQQQAGYGDASYYYSEMKDYYMADA